MALRLNNIKVLAMAPWHLKPEAGIFRIEEVFYQIALKT
jgi:hypothetical protein